MSTIKLLSRPASYFALTSLSQTRRTITGCLSTGVVSLDKNFALEPRHYALTYPTNYELRFLVATPSTSIKWRGLLSKKAPQTLDSQKQKDDGTPVKPTDDADVPPNVDDLIFGAASKLTQFEKFKLMYKKYWYVLIPVHVATSISWVAGFYYLSKSGVDIPAILEYIQISETFIEKLKGSDMGHYAIAYFCYKVVTPLRYAVTLGITTVSIKRLVLAGYIKPIPTKKEFIKMLEQKKADRAKRKEDEAKTH